MDHWFGPGAGRKNKAIKSLLDWMHRPVNLLRQIPEIDIDKLMKAYEEWEMRPETVRKIDFLEVERVRIQIEDTQAGLLRYIDIWTLPVVEVLEKVPNTCTQTLDQLRAIRHWEENQRRRREQQLIVALPALPPIPDRLALPAPSEGTSSTLETLEDPRSVSTVQFDPPSTLGSTPSAHQIACLASSESILRESLEMLVIPRYVPTARFGLPSVIGTPPVALLCLPAPPVLLALPAPPIKRECDDKNEMSQEEGRPDSVSKIIMVELSPEEDRPDSSHSLSAGSEGEREEVGPALLGIDVGLEADFCADSQSRSLQSGELEYSARKSSIESEIQLKSELDQEETLSIDDQIYYDEEAYCKFLASLPPELKNTVVEKFEEILTRTSHL